MRSLDLERAALQQALDVLRYDIESATDHEQVRLLRRTFGEHLKQWLALHLPDQGSAPSQRRYVRCQLPPEELGN
jgi:hypothetical protein